ncbi:hypothetical protein [Croceicoccus estronivorus]|uniref:hypothetical protein n=1 Tax=Croceicoccus estronivorus TaxID=1172626 RepID=UPI0012E8434A|nr:hypothetical protein [Croceicoccus estronivorus]
MKRVAEALGVGIATLYDYVQGRSELVQLAVARRVETLPLAVDRGQGWEDYLFDYAGSLQTLMVDNPGVLEQFVFSGFGLEAEARISGRLMLALVKRGFAPAEAVKLSRAAGYIAVGAAVCIRRVNNTQTDWGNEALDGIDEEGLELLSEQRDLYTKGLGDLAKEMLRPLVDETAKKRGRLSRSGT